MFKSIATAAMASALAVSMTVAASAQNAADKPADPAVTAPSPSTSTTPSASPSTDATTTPSTTTTSPSTTASNAPMMTDDEAKAWVNKTVYSSDGKNLGEVAEVLRDNSGHVKELHADIGGFLGIGETRVRVLPDQFKLASDRVILNIPGDKASTLPHLPK